MKCFPKRLLQAVTSAFISSLKSDINLLCNNQALFQVSNFVPSCNKCIVVPLLKSDIYIPDV